MPVIHINILNQLCKRVEFSMSVFVQGYVFKNYNVHYDYDCMQR